MDSAGKRITRPPNRLIDQVLQPEVVHSPDTNMANNDKISSANGANDTSIMVSGQSAPRTQAPDDPVQEMLKKIMAGMQTEARKTKTNMETMQAEARSTREEMTSRFDQCLERWQMVDTRLAKVEDEQIRLENQVVQQERVVQLNTSRISVLEDEVATIRNDLCRLTIHPTRTSCNHDTIQKPPTLPTAAPPDVSAGFQSFAGVTIPPSSTINPMCSQATLNTTGQGYSTFFGSQERLNDAVSEFSGQNRSIHPEHFIRQLEIYFETVPMSANQQLISAQRRLSGDARLWYDSLIPTPTNYRDFRVLFRQRFWSAATQRKTRNEVFRPFQFTRYDGLATHAMQWIAGAKYLSPPIDQSDLVSTIIQHYPIPLSMALRGRGPRDTNELLAVLTEFEESTSFCEQRPEEHRPPRVNTHPNLNSDRRGGYRGGNNHHYQSRNQLPNPPSVPVHHLDVSGNEEEPRQ